MVKNNTIKNKADLLNENKSKVSFAVLKNMGYFIKHTYPDNISIAERKNKDTDLPKTLEILDEENIEWKTWENEKGDIHREINPAVIYYKDNKIINKEWYLNNRNYSGSPNKASSLEFYPTGLIKKIMWTNSEGFYHSLNFPSYFYYDKKENIVKQTWYTHGEPTRKNDALHLPTTIYIQNNKIIDFEYLIKGYNITKVIKNWMNDNNFTIYNIDKELFYINFIN